MEELKISNSPKTKNIDAPTVKRKRDPFIKGKLDNEGFYRTPNGSFWDPDGEYFNRNGFDINSGFYSDLGEYIPGPDWLSEYGCYPEEKEKYLNINFDDEFGDLENEEEKKDDKEKDDEVLSEGWETVEEDEI